MNEWGRVDSMEYFQLSLLRVDQDEGHGRFQQIGKSSSNKFLSGYLSHWIARVLFKRERDI